MDDAAATCRKQVDRVLQEPVGRHAPPLRIRRREVLADVAGADRAEHRVGQGVKGDVGVGVSGQCLAMRNGDAAQHDGIAGGEAMDVETHGGARLHHRCTREIVGRRDLPVILAACHHHHLQSRALGHRCVVRKRRRFGAGQRRHGTMRFEQGNEAEDLRCLRSPEIGPWHGLDHGSLRIGPLDRIRQRHAENGAVDTVCRGGRQAACNVRWPNKGTRRIVDGDEIRGLANQGLEAVQNRLLPGRAAEDGPRQVQALDRGCIMGFRTRRDDDANCGNPASSAIGKQRMSQYGLAIENGVLLGQRATEAAPASGGNDKGDAGRHRR